MTFTFTKFPHRSERHQNVYPAPASGTRTCTPPRRAALRNCNPPRRAAPRTCTPPRRAAPGTCTPPQRAAPELVTRSGERRPELVPRPGERQKHLHSTGRPDSGLDKGTATATVSSSLEPADPTLNQSSSAAGASDLNWMYVYRSKQFYVEPRTGESFNVEPPTVAGPQRGAVQRSLE